MARLGFELATSGLKSNYKSTVLLDPANLSGENVLTGVVANNLQASLT